MWLILALILLDSQLLTGSCSKWGLRLLVFIYRALQGHVVDLQIMWPINNLFCCNNLSVTSKYTLGGNDAL